MPACFQLQDLRTIEADHPIGFVFRQAIDEAVEVLPFRTLVVQVRRPLLSDTSGTNVLLIQHASELDEYAFQSLGSPIDLNASDNQAAVFTHPLRYVRWLVSLGATGAKTLTFLVDVVARET